MAPVVTRAFRKYFQFDMPSSRRVPDRDPTAFTALTKIHKHAVLQCTFSPDTDQILTGGEDSTVVLWNIPPRNIILHDETINDDHKLVCYRLTDHRTPVMSISMHKRLFVSASKDGHVKLWKLISETGPRVQDSYKQPSSESPSEYICSNGITRSIDLSKSAHEFVTGSDDRSVRIFSTECRNKSLMAFVESHGNWIRCVRWCKTNESLLASCGDDGRLCIWDTRQGNKKRPTIQIRLHKRMSMNCLEWHPIFEHHIATGDQEGECAVWDTRKQEKIQSYHDHKGSINSLAFHPGGSLLMTGSNDKTTKIFDVCRGLNLYTLLSHKGPVTSVCFNSTGELIATGSQDKTVTIWERNFDVVNIEIGQDEGGVDLEFSQQISENFNGSFGDSNHQTTYPDQYDYEPSLRFRSQMETTNHKKHFYDG